LITIVPDAISPFVTVMIRRCVSARDSSSPERPAEQRCQDQDRERLSPADLRTSHAGPSARRRRPCRRSSRCSGDCARPAGSRPDTMSASLPGSREPGGGRSGSLSPAQS
jgi:hypothetical protein